MKKYFSLWFVLLVLLMVVCAGGFAQAAEGSAPAGEWKIAFSNSYVGNAWRTTSLNIYNAYTRKLIEQGIIAEAYSSSAGVDVQAQINEIRNMISEGYDAIVVNAASETGLTSVLEEAVERGIVIVCFDANVESDLVYNVNTDQVQYGRLLAENLVKNMGPEGNILWIQGIEGNAVTLLRTQGIKEVLDANPGINVLGTGYGGWDDSTTAVAMAELMSAYSAQGIDGIVDEGGGGHAIVESLVEYDYDVKNFPLSEGEMFNSFMKDWVERDLQKVFTTAQPPYLTAAAVDVALQVLNGEEVERMVIIDTPTCSSAAEAAEKWYVPSQDGNFVCDWTDNNNTWGLTIEELYQ